MGLPLIVLLIVIAYSKRGDGVFRFLFAMLGIIAICSLGPSLHLAGPLSTGIPLPWRLVDLLPVFHDVQTNRFGEYLYLLVGLILAHHVADRSVPHNRRATRVIVTLAALTFLFPRIPLYPATHADVPDFFRLPRDTRRIASPALIIPVATGTLLTNRATAMLWQAEARMAFKMPEGYAFGQGKGPWPPPTPLSTALLQIEDVGRAPIVTSALRVDIAAVLEKERIRTIVLGPFEHEPEALNFLTEVLGTPAAVDGVYLWRNVDRSTPNHRRVPDGATPHAVVGLGPR